jgi:putative addiction module CopG family antidote
MALAVPPHLESLVLERVRSGVYPSAEEVLELALRLLVWAEGDPAGKRQILRLAIQAGIEDSEAGNVVPGDEVARRMRKRVRGEDP